MKPASSSSTRRIHELEARVAALEKENSDLRQLSTRDTPSKPSEEHRPFPVQKLSTDDVERYSRQLLLDDGFGVEGQKKLLSSSVLVVGAGGIGSTVLLYLASSGVGKLTIVDFDSVETSNLHRQVIHKARAVGVNKALSARLAVLELNPKIECDAVTGSIDHENAFELVQKHNCVVDASDNPRTRYLINDACVLARKPLVSGSAVGTEGQLTVYNHLGGPCYRCLYPRAQISASSCQSCSDAGVLGPVPGLIGILQSMETLKILTGIGSTQHDRLLMYDSLQASFLSVKKPGKSPKCPVCSPLATIHSMQDSFIDLEHARGPSSLEACAMNSQSFSDGFQVSCIEFSTIRQQGDSHVLLDVRVTRQFEMCSLPDAINIPLERIPEELDFIESLSNGSKPVYCLCRRGVASLEATRLLSQARENGRRIHSVWNVVGGLNAWHDQVDETFPRY